MKIFFAALAGLILFACAANPALAAESVPGLNPGFSAQPSRSVDRTFDRLSPRELDQLSGVTLAYYQCVSGKLETITGADNSSSARILETYPPHIRIIRQQCRISLLNVEKMLYSLDLNPEFITNYTTMLRDDVVYFALDQVVKNAAGKQTDERAGQEGNGKGANASETGKDKTGQERRSGGGTGLGLFTGPGEAKKP